MKKAHQSRQGASIKRDIGPPKKGAILAALRRSSLVGAGLILARSPEARRKFDLRRDRHKN